MLVCIYAFPAVPRILTLAYTLVGITIGGSSWFRLFVALVIVLIGLAFIAVEFVPSVDLPANMNPEGMGMELQDEDVV